MADIPKITVHHSGDPVTRRDLLLTAEPVVRTVNQLLDRPEAHSILIEGVSLVAASTVNVPHKLGRPWRGWHVVDKDADAGVWRGSAPAGDGDGEQYLPLACSANVTISLVVF